MNGAVVVEYRKVYGSVVIYPASENAALLAKLAGKKTLSESDLAIARQLDAIEIACQRVMYQRARAEALPESDGYVQWLQQLTDSCVSDAEIGRRAREIVAHYMQDVAVLSGEDLADFAEGRR